LPFGCVDEEVFAEFGRVGGLEVEVGVPEDEAVPPLRDIRDPSAACLHGIAFVPSGFDVQFPPVTKFCGKVIADALGDGVEIDAVNDGPEAEDGMDRGELSA
jgi:hypothetical protein